MKVVYSFDMVILEPFSWMKHGSWECGNVEGYCLRRNWIWKTLSGGFVGVGIWDRRLVFLWHGIKPHRIWSLVPFVHIPLLENNNINVTNNTFRFSFMSRNSTHLQVPTAGSQYDQSRFGNASQQSRNKKPSFYFGDDTPQGGQSALPSKVPSRKGSFPSRNSGQESPQESRGFSDKRTNGYYSDLDKLPSMLKALEARAEGQGGDSVSGKQVSRVSRGGSSSGDRTTVQ
jgi:hypothetical protein